MPRRRTLFANGEIYHIFNRSVATIPIFKGLRENDLFLETMKFYLQKKPPTRFSIYRKSRPSFPVDLSQKLVTILAYCLMPNHFHFILRQEQDDGIKRFIQRISSSFAHYFNIKNKRKGHVFADKFKAIRIETEEQLLHLSRYIHLNPVTSYITDKPEDYPYSSYKIYLGQEDSEIVNPSIVLNYFPSREEYKEFVLSQKNYQRTLGSIKHLMLEP